MAHRNQPKKTKPPKNPAGNPSRKPSLSSKPPKAAAKVVKPAPLLSRLAKGMARGVAQGMVKAMGAKTTKKSQTKAPPTMSKGKKATGPKHPPKPPVKAVKPALKSSVKQTVKPSGKVPAPKAATKASLKPGATAREKAPKGARNTHALNAPVVAVLAPVAKVSKGKGEKAKGSSSKSAAQALMLAERMCRESGCENPSTTKGYCRLDYIKNWKKIKRKEMILKEGKLNQYIEELVSKYPDKYIEVIRQDLSTEVNFTKVIHDLELDESIDDLDYDGDSIDSLIGAIRKEDDGFDDTDF
jgi:hypothetical protein